MLKTSSLSSQEAQYVVWHMDQKINVVGERCFLSCHECGTKIKFWVLMRN